MVRPFVFVSGWTAVLCSVTAAAPPASLPDSGNPGVHPPDLAAVDANRSPPQRLEVCGGFAGIACADPQTFCKLPEGGCCCDFQGVCTPVPMICPTIFDPVCGCDGVTYGNECEADAARVSVDHRGPCEAICGGIAGIVCADPKTFCKLPEGGCCCDFQGVCTPVPTNCLTVFDPVCGCDGVTYGNECEAEAARVSIDHRGPCGVERCGGFTGMVCTTPGTFCKFDLPGCCCDLSGVCVPVRTNCPDVFDPVCGCDGLTYGNECEANFAGQTLNHFGACSSPCFEGPPAQPDPAAVATNRYLGVSPGNPGLSVAIMITFEALPPPFDAWDGLSMWAGPPRTVSESPSATDVTPGFPTFQAATLRCSPFFMSWGVLGTVHLFHNGIVPGGRYSVSLVDQRCSLADPRSYSAPLQVTMSAWGDVAAPWDMGNGVWPGPDGRVDVTVDVVAAIDTFSGRGGAPSKTRVDLQPATPDQVIDIQDILGILDAFRGFTYPVTPGEAPCRP